MVKHFCAMFGDLSCSGIYPHMPIGKMWIYRLLYVFL